MKGFFNADVVDDEKRAVMVSFSLLLALAFSPRCKHAFEPVVAPEERHEAYLDAHGGRQGRFERGRRGKKGKRVSSTASLSLSSLSLSLFLSKVTESATSTESLPPLFLLSSLSNRERHALRERPEGQPPRPSIPKPQKSAKSLDSDLSWKNCSPKIAEQRAAAADARR